MSNLFYKLEEGQEEEVKENQEIQEENMETPEEESEGDVVTTNPVSSNEIRQCRISFGLLE